MLCHRLISPGQLGRRIYTLSTLAVRTQASSGANFVITISEGSASTSRGYPDRNRAVRKDKCREPTLRYSTDNTRVTMHKKKSKTPTIAFPLLLTWVLGHFCVYHFFFRILYPFFFLTSFLLFFSPHFRTKEEWSSGSRSLDLACFGGWDRLTELVASQIVIQ